MKAEVMDTLFLIQGAKSKMKAAEEELTKLLIRLVKEHHPVEESTFCIIKGGKAILWFYYCEGTEEYGPEIELDCRADSDPIFIFWK